MVEAAKSTEWLGLDPDLAAIARDAATRASIFATPLRSRRLMDEAAAATARTAPPIDVLAVEDRDARSSGLTVPVRIYHPPHPSGVVALFYHGGGFVVGSVRQSDRIARKLCRDTGAVIVSVDYRLAPDHPYPAAHDDARAAALWVHEHQVALGGTAGAIALIGESAGANLAAATAIALRDRGSDVLAQVLIAAGLDFARDLAAMGLTGRRFPMLNDEDLRLIGELYIQDGAVALATCPPSPLHAASLRGLPPTLVVVPGFCPLQQEGRSFARLLNEAGVPVTVLELADMFHPFLGFFDLSAGALRANDMLCATTAQLFATARAARPALADVTP